MALGRLLLRVIVGGLFVGHGLQKLAGWFGGGGLDQTGAFFESVGMRPGRRHALAAGAAETGGGALLALGLLTPFGCAALIGVMSTAIGKVHLRNGIWVSEGGFEYNLVLIAALTLLAEAGPGRLSLDAAIGSERRGVAWGLGALAAGLGASAALARATAADGDGTAAQPEAEPHAEAVPA
jgi:putative oxidoreductase